LRDVISARKGGEFVLVPPHEINYMDVSPKQLVSVAASLIPFLENDDANRALMGSDMQRQAVPLLRTDTRIVGIGIQASAAPVLHGPGAADGPCTAQAERALGRNVLGAFMPWAGYNFEDDTVISERVVKAHISTSIHIEEFGAEACDTKQGKEEITRDIPNVGEEALRNLDDSGIIRIGAKVTPSDILVGKITPKGETQLSHEEKLLKAIFDEKA